MIGDARENAIEFYENEKTATFSFTQGRYISKIKKLAKQYPDECQILAENQDGSIYGHIPTKWVKVSPPRKVEMSEERKEMGRKYLQMAREQKNMLRTL